MHRCISLNKCKKHPDHVLYIRNKRKKSQIKCICNCINKDHKHSATSHFFPFHLYMYMDVIILKYTSLRLNIRPVDGWIFVEVFYFRYCHVVIILFTMLGYATGQRKITWQIVINIFVSLLSTGKWKKKMTIQVISHIF